MDNLLGRIIVVDDLTEASAVAKRLSYRNRIVTLDGQVVNAGGSFTGGSTARSAGVFTPQNRKLDELREKLATLDKRRAEAERETSARKAEVDNLAAQVAGAESESVNAASARLRASLRARNGSTLPSPRVRPPPQRRKAEIDALTETLQKDKAARAQADTPRVAAEAELERYTAELQTLGESSGTLTAEREQITADPQRGPARTADPTKRTSACTKQALKRCAAAAARPPPARGSLKPRSTAANATLKPTPPRPRRSSASAPKPRTRLPRPSRPSAKRTPPGLKKRPRSPAWARKTAP